MPERPQPDLDHVRDAMREHDERQPDPEEPAPEPPPPEEPNDEPS